VIISLGSHTPHVAPDAWVAPTAVVAGRVTVHAGASLWYGVVVRADCDEITIGEGSNLQDNVVCHADPGTPLTVGAGVTVGHAAILHGCTIEDGALVGMGSTVLNGAVVGAGAMVAASALVPEGFVVPPRTLVAGIPARVIRELRPEECERVRGSATVYAGLRDLHRGATVSNSHEADSD
jgi:carbonic anhydrase/acetyltransferase-like protein (isoleucine patch superfamily)